MSEACKFFESLIKLTIWEKADKSIGKDDEKSRIPPVVITAAI
jgi:hypothetical protein